jgi:hypothetical protein
VDYGGAQVSAQPLAGRNALVLGVERPAGRRIAIAFAEAGADVALLTLSDETSAVFAANSTANEFWAIGRKAVVLTTTGEGSLSTAVAEAGVLLGPISIAALIVWHAIPREALAALRSDPAIIVVVEEGAPDAAALLAWTRDLAASGLRANALVTSRDALPDDPILKEHHPPEPMDLARAAGYLASDATAAIEGAMVIAHEA